MNFFSAGSYISKEIGKEIYVGLKEPRESGNKEYLKHRLIFELAVMSVVAQNLPHLLPELPLFYGLLVDGQGKPMGIVTEAFSEDGKYSIYTSSIIPKGIRDLFIEETVEDDFIDHISFNLVPKNINTVGTKQRLGDFYPLLRNFLPDEKKNAHRSRFPEEQIENDLDKYSLKANLSF